MNFDDYKYKSDLNDYVKIDEQDFVIVQEYTGYRTMVVTASSLQDAIDQIEAKDETNVHTYAEDDQNNVHGRVVSAKVMDYEQSTTSRA
jgi:hypothetical protein